MNVTLGFIGCGNMAKAMIGGILKNGILMKEQIIASAVSDSTVAKVSEQFGIKTTKDNLQVVENSDIIFLAVKPQYYETVIHEIREKITDNQIIVSIAPGKTVDWLGDLFGKEVKIVRTMPNTPALVLEGMTGVCKNNNVTAEELEEVCRILNGFGKAAVVKEDLMDVVVSVSGSSPAYVFLFIEAMADAAVADGMPRNLAYEFAASAVLGSAKMVIETKKHPGELKDMVCSPGGTTIEAIRVLEEKGFRSSVIEAMKACTKKAREL
ncbi:pyrroline-5-carboxylate reductase [Anaeromicropila herbilytica]|uniref:Pyrroline-5-carboxylate reductase n=1 Tax=Anaeromicropila herbilytica TaxID=2785025 RepID=A0A7R7IF74_9FIRM|nr:pyrroline-5-carboxylate reductase [Anaeromicropila herbilytica]BCN32811.1 pyrroline-5-carboxylate reductase [Anaeromicropila herbilytica]